MPLTHGVNLGHMLLVPESVSSQLTMPPLRMPKMSLLPKSRSPAEIFGRSTLSGLIEALAWPVIGSRHSAEHVSQEHQGTLSSHSYLFRDLRVCPGEMS